MLDNQEQPTTNQPTTQVRRIRWTFYPVRSSSRTVPEGIESAHICTMTIIPLPIS